MTPPTERRDMNGKGNTKGVRVVAVSNSYRQNPHAQSMHVLPVSHTWHTGYLWQIKLIAQTVQIKVAFKKLASAES